MKTKVRIKKDYPEKYLSIGDVGYIDSYIADDSVLYAIAIFRKRIVHIPIGNLEVIEEDY